MKMYTKVVSHHMRGMSMKYGAVEYIISHFHSRTCIATTPNITNAIVEKIRKEIPVNDRCLVVVISDANMKYTIMVPGEMRPIISLEAANHQYEGENELKRATVIPIIVQGTNTFFLPYLKKR